MLKATGLMKRYQKKCVVKNVSLEVSPGEIVGLLGPNGAGKTTCFYMIAGLIAADAGEVWLDNTLLTPYPMHVRAQKGLGYLPQEASVFRYLTVAQNILAILELNPNFNKTEREERCQALIHEFHLESVKDTLGIRLSGGERRRVEIARALASNPRFILLDEPFAGVDPISVADIKKEIQHLAKRGIGILITDHNVRETLAICHRATIMSHGIVLASGTPQSIVEHADVRAVYLGDSFSL